METQELRKSLYKRLKTFVKDLIKITPDDELESTLDEVATLITKAGAATKVPIVEEQATVKKTAYKQFKPLIRELVELSSEDELIELESSMKEIFSELDVDEDGHIIPEKQDIAILDIYPSTKKLLRENDIDSIEELLLYSEQDLMSIQGFGRKAVMRIDDALKKLGLKGLRVEELQK